MKIRLILHHIFIFLLCFILFGATIFLILKKKEKKGDDLPTFFLLLNEPYAYVDKGFHQAILNGTCNFLNIASQQCLTSNPQFNARISYGYSGTVVDPKKIYDYLKSQVLKYPHQKRIFLLPGYNFTAFLNSYLKQFDPKLDAFFSVDTFFNPVHSKLPGRWPSNLYEYGFNQQYAGYNAGLYAAIQALLRPDLFKDADQNSNNGKQIRFASLGGLKIPAIAAYALGFKLAIEKVNDHRRAILKAIKNSSDPLVRKMTTKLPINPDQKVELSFFKNLIIGGFDLQLNGKETYHLAQKLFKKHRVSVLFSIAVNLTSIMQKVANEQNYLQKNRQHWVVGVDIDQAAILAKDQAPITFEPSPTVFLVSAKINLQKLTTTILHKIDSGQKALKSQKIGNLDTKNDREYVQIPERYQNLTNPVWLVYQRVLDQTLIAGQNLAMIAKSQQQALQKLIFKSVLPSHINLVFEQILNNPSARVLSVTK